MDPELQLLMPYRLHDCITIVLDPVDMYVPVPPPHMLVVTNRLSLRPHPLPFMPAYIADSA